MTTDQAKDTIRAKLRDYLPIVGAKQDRKGRDMYSCPLCGSGTHNTSTSDGAFHVTGDKWFCHSCNRGGDIFDLYAIVNNLDTRNDFGQIVTGLADLLGVQIDQDNQRKESPLNPLDQERRRMISECAEKLSGSPAEAYLRERGFSDEIMKKYRLGYDPEKKAVIIPYPGTAYFTRRIISVSTTGGFKYDNPSGEAPTFIIKERASNNYIITEGQLDALSLVQAGAGNVIASHYPTKIEKLIKTITISGALIVGDNDEPGRKTVERLKGVFTENGIPCVKIYPPDGYKDSNDLLKADQKKLEAMIAEGAAKLKAAVEAKPKKQAKPALVPVNGKAYFSAKQFDKDLDYFRKYKDRKTGFSNIDKYLRLYPGLALLTGSTSLGKTTFATQLCDQLIERGETVIYFSLEQLPIEIFTKSLARGYYNIGGNNFTNRDIREGATDSRLEAVKGEFIKTADRFNIVVCDFNVSGDKIVKYVEDFMKETGIKPIVIVDYLQLVSAPEGERLDDRGRVDDAIKRLKTLSKDHELFVLAISNMARSSYREKIAEDSYKETGLAEYSADYLFGLQLAILEDKEFFTKTGSRGGEKETLKSEKQDQIDEASEQNPKLVVFKALKNRQGQKTFKAFFKYRPDYDLFIVDDDSKYDKHSQSYKHEHSVTEYKHRPR